MPDPDPLADYHWLVSAEAEPLLVAALADSRPTLAQVESLRKVVSPARAGLVVEQAELRRRARGKFRLAEQLFFDRIALEQATDELTAAYKASRFPEGKPVADLCCGIGGDLMALAARGDVVGIERNEHLAVLALANSLVREQSLPARQPYQVAVQSSDVREFDVSNVAGWHIDPDRRPQGRRTTQIDLHEPGAEVWAFLLQQNPRAAIKLAPAAKLTPEWESQTELEWISRAGSCRQLVLWCGELAALPGQRRATVLGESPSEGRSISGRPAPFPLQATPSRYLYEPDAAVLAADLVGELVAEHALAAIIPGGGYLTGDTLVDDPALAAFEVQEVLPFQVKVLKNLLRERQIGRLEVKKRGVDHEPERLRRELSVTGDNAATLIVTRLTAGVTAILARRITTS